MDWGAANARAITDAHTETVSYFERRKLLDLVGWAIWTGAEDRLLRKRYSEKEPLEKYHVKNARKFGDYLTKHKAFPADLRAKLSKLREGRTDAPFLVVRGLYPRTVFFRAPGKIKKGADPAIDSSDTANVDPLPWYISGCYYDIISSGLIAQLGAVHKAKDVDDEHIYRNYFTSPYAAVDQFGNDADLPLRFRNAVPEFRFDDDPQAKIGTLTARYALYVCVNNPWLDPIWVLSSDAVAAELTQKEKSLLEADRFVLFDHWHSSLRSRYKSEVQRVLEVRKTRTGEIAFLSFDANRIHIDHPETHVEGREAIAALCRKIQRTAASHAMPVVLSRGDVLIVDNYRGLVRRTANTNAPLMPRSFGNPRRWLRMHCGFPPSLSPSPRANGPTATMPNAHAGPEPS